MSGVASEKRRNMHTPIPVAPNDTTFEYDDDEVVVMQERLDERRSEEELTEPSYGDETELERNN